MKKALLFSFFIFLFSITLWAQPNITVNNFPFIERAIYQPVDSSTVAGFGTNVNTFWDFGSVQQKSAHRTVYYTQVSNHPVFTTATEKTEAIAFFGPLPIKQNIFRQKNNAGYYSLGIGYEKQKISLGFLSGTNTDSVTFPAQTHVFNLPYTEFTFPLTTNTQWAAASVARTNFTIDLALLGFNNTPCYFLNFFNASHQAISYGTCQVPAKAGLSPIENVLLVKSEIIRVDSFYIDNVPANAFLLGSLGLNQGDTIRDYQYRFLRENSGAQELAIISFEDDSYTTVKSAEYSAEFDVLSVGDIILSHGYVVYPNPVANNTFNVYIEKPFTAIPVFTLTNMAGKTTPLTVQQSSNGQYQISTEDKTATGVYFLHIKTDTKTTTKKLLLK